MPELLPTAHQRSVPMLAFANSCCPPQREGGGAYSSLILPARDDALVGDGPLGDFAVFGGYGYAFAVAPPAEVGDAAAAFDAHLRFPLQTACVEDVDYATALSSRAEESHVCAVWAELEGFHTPLFVLLAVDAGDLLYVAGVQVPDVEVSSPR